MQIRKLHEQQGIRLAARQTSADARIVVLDAKLMVRSQPKEGDDKKMKGETPEESAWKETEAILLYLTRHQVASTRNQADS